MSAQASKMPTVADMLKEAREHLSFCGYGDKYERECARESKLEERIDEALARAAASQTVHVIMTNDYPAAVVGSPELVPAAIEAEKNKQRERYKQVYSNPEEIEERIRIYHVRAYEFEVVNEK